MSNTLSPGIGMLLASSSVFVAAILEVYRKNIMRSGGWEIQVLAGQSFNASTLSVFAQVPQFTLIGASEVFASITGRLTKKGNTVWLMNFVRVQFLQIYTKSTSNSEFYH